MKFLIFGDPHWSSYSSIVRSRGPKYSLRLENLIASMDWVEATAVRYGCDAVVCLGDFFDKAELNSEEVTALQDIKWSNIPHYYLVGNHEMGRSDLSFSSSHLFNLCPNSVVVDQPEVLFSDDTHEVCALPYILESERKEFNEYFPHTSKSRVVFSHNDLSGIQMGKFISKEGFSIESIENNCSLFINGHLHNGSWVSSKIINVGNLSGQNFSEDAEQYSHNVMILDNVARSIEWEENPYAFNFYKIDLTDFKDGVTDEGDYCVQQLLSSLKLNAVVTIKVTPQNKMFIEDLISTCYNIVCCRVVVDNMKGDKIASTVSDVSSMSLDHLQKFSDYVKEYLGTASIVIEELQKVIE